MFGKKHSTETRETLSELKRGKYEGADNPMYGVRQTVETKKKIGKGRVGSKWMYNPQTDEQSQIPFSKVIEYQFLGWELGKRR